MNSPKTVKNTKNNKWQIPFLIIILVWALIVRLIFLGTDSMWIDETISAVASKSILENGHAKLESNSTYSRAEYFHYMMAASMLIFGQNDFAARIPSVIFGLLTVYLAWLYSNRFFKNEQAKIIFPLFIALSSLEIIYSKQARFYQAYQFFYFLTIYLFFKFVIYDEKIFKKRIYGYILTIISLLFAIETQISAIVLIPLLILSYVIIKPKLLFTKKIFLKKETIIVIIGLIASLIYVIIKIDTLLFLDIDYITNYANLYSKHILTAIPFAILAIIGMLIALKEKPKEHLSLLLLIILPTISMIFIKLFATRYIYFAFFGIFFYIAYSFQKIYFKIPIAIIAIIFFSGTVFSPTGIEKPNLDFTMPLADYKGAYTYISQNETLKKQKIATNWPPATMWYLNKNPDYWTYFSIDGTSSKWMIKNDREIFSNAEIAYTPEIFTSNTTLILDMMQAGKLNKKFDKYIKERCELSYSSYNIQVFTCNNYNIN